MIYLGADHAGFQLKEDIKRYLGELDVEVEDLGAYEFDENDDYPDYILSVAEKVAALGDARGIVFGGSGQGENMAANKVKGIRSVVYYGGPLDIVKLSRQHNNANILSLGARFINTEQAKEVVALWFKTEFEGGRHERRLQKIADSEKDL